MAKRNPETNRGNNKKKHKQIVQNKQQLNSSFETREYLMSLIDNAPYGVIAINLEGTVTIMNLLAAEYLNLDRNLNESINHTALPLLEDIPELRDVIRACLTEGLKPFDLRCIPCQHRYLSIKGRMILKGLLITIEDITEQKQSKEKLVQNQFLLEEFQKIARVGGWEADLITGEGYLTEEVYHIHELSPDEKMNIEKGLSFFPPDSKPIIENAVNDLIEKGTEYDLELPFITAKGNHRWIRAIGKPVYDGKKIVKIRGIFSDITSLKEAEQSFKKQAKVLSILNKELEEFAYISSHDMKSPVTSIDGLISLMDKRKAVKDEFLDIFEMAKKTVKQMRSTVLALNEMFTFRNTLEIQREEIKFEEALADVQTGIHQLLTTSGATIKADFSKCPYVYYPPVHLKSILQNLITNAIKYSKKDEKPVIEIKTTKSKNSVLLTVKDNGLGMDMKLYRSKLFGLFQRFHTHAEGMGVGLHMINSIVKSYGGAIDVESQVDKGTTFKIYIDHANVQ